MYHGLEYIAQIDVETIGKKPIGLQAISDKVDNKEVSLFVV